MHPVDILLWSCLFLGGAYTVITLLMGGFSHVAGHLHVGSADASHLGGHADVGHLNAGHAGHVDVGHAAHGADGAHGGHGGHGGHAEVHHGHEVDVEEGAGRFNIMAYLNPMSVAGFLLGFGGVGVVSRILGVHHGASLLFGGAGGFGLWLLAYLVATKVFAASEGTSHNMRERLVGSRAQVIAPLLNGKPGTICFVVSGARQSMRAICDGQLALKVGQAVRIRRIEADTAFVVPIDQMGADIEDALCLEAGAPQSVAAADAAEELRVDQARPDAR